jgi:hypothetical protein
MHHLGILSFLIEGFKNTSIELDLLAGKKISRNDKRLIK